MSLSTFQKRPLAELEAKQEYYWELGAEAFQLGDNPQFLKRCSQILGILEDALDRAETAGGLYDDSIPF